MKKYCIIQKTLVGLAVSFCFAMVVSGTNKSAPKNSNNASEKTSKVASSSEQTISKVPKNGVFSSPDEWGPYGVGYVLLEFVDNKRKDRHVPVAIYYPANTKRVKELNKLRYNKEFPFSVADSAAKPVRPKVPYPVIIFSHGMLISKNYYTAYTEFMASHGFIVIACDHLEAIEKQIDPHATANRVLDIIFTLDKVSERMNSSEFLLKGLGDFTNVGMSGHSYGGNITALISGAKLTGDTANFDFLEKAYLHDNIKLKIAEMLPDKRIKAAISMAGNSASRFYAPNGKGFSSIKIPFMYMGSKLDEVCKYNDEAPYYFGCVSGTSYLLTFLKEGHSLPYVNPSGDKPLSRNKHALMRYACAFWSMYLKHDSRYAKYLTAEETAVWNKGFDDITFESKH
jgi:predicted dienelactone hydrolase